MWVFWIPAVFFTAVSCTRGNNPPVESPRVAALEQQIADLKPGLGEIMGVIQQHHAKLYFSGNAGNWPLADYQLGEIKEGLENVVKYHAHFKDLNLPLNELVPKTMDEKLAMVAKSIHEKNKKAFLESFNALTTACNSCHQAAQHPFIVVQAPKGTEFSNQSFSPQ